MCSPRQITVLVTASMTSLARKVALTYMRADALTIQLGGDEDQLTVGNVEQEVARVANEVFVFVREQKNDHLKSPDDLICNRHTYQTISSPQRPKE